MWRGATLIRLTRIDKEKFHNDNNNYYHYEIFLYQSLLILRVLKLLPLVLKTLNTQTLQRKPETDLKQQQLKNSNNRNNLYNIWQIGANYFLFVSNVILIFWLFRGF